MPPRIATNVAACARAPSSEEMIRSMSLLSVSMRTTPVLQAGLYAFLAPRCQTRNASILSSLSDNPSAYNRRKRVGRGPSSGMGKTSGRGHKGQKQHGKVPARFQGGQTPLWIAKHQKGFENLFTTELSVLNLNRIQSWINQGRLDPSQPITVKELAKSRCLHGYKDGVKLLAKGSEALKTPINILVSRASKSAIEAVEAAGGTITTRYYTRASIKRLMQGESENSSIPIPRRTSTESDASLLAEASPFAYRLPDPTSRKDIEYYRDPAHRGYLSHMVKKGQGPSLYFKTPGTSKVKRKKAIPGQAVGDNKIW